MTPWQRGLAATPPEHARPGSTRDLAVVTFLPPAGLWAKISSEGEYHRRPLSAQSKFWARIFVTARFVGDSPFSQEERFWAE